MGLFWLGKSKKETVKNANPNDVDVSKWTAEDREIAFTIDGQKQEKIRIEDSNTRSKIGVIDESKYTE